MQEKYGLNALQLKLGMAVLMVFDHITTIPGLVNSDWTGLLHLLTRPVAAWFAFAAVEGFIYTRNRWLYIRRLLTWGALMWAGNSVLNLFLVSKGLLVENNIFLTLACGVLLLKCWFDSSTIWSYVGGILVCVVGLLFTEGGLVLIPFMLISYLCRNNVKKRNAWYLLLTVVLFSMSIVIYPTWQETLQMLVYNSDWAFISVFPFLYLYNGERGKVSFWSKYFFYVFYPLHLWLIALLAYFVS
ncbi:TraX family protein [Streptococcus pneumoniae]